jgi:cell division transport system permease protein
MAETGRSSLRRSKPNYAYSIIGVAIVLLILGIMGWILISLKMTGESLKEKVRISAYLATANKDSINQVQQYITAQPYAMQVTYTDKEQAKKIWNQENNEDWSKILDENPFPESIDFYAKAAYVNKDSLAKITQDIKNTFGTSISDITYRQSLVNNLGESTSRLGIIFLGIAIVLVVIVIISIDNTIKLMMFSNRFLIKTMQMVGATRGFIIRPMSMRAVLNGFISALIAIITLFGLMKWVENELPELEHIHDNTLTLSLFGALIFLGIIISLFSTHRSVVKYLKMKLDELY